ncbi:hypothetical protein [Amycolatopsis sp. NPDC059657]|uniref:hypothetical protein n=1 Tax=Amycolatopsis sp. NPDC059657 TaxID=3346899 RepID=UPI0036732B89
MRLFTARTATGVSSALAPRIPRQCQGVRVEALRDERLVVLVDGHGDVLAEMTPLQAGRLRGLLRDAVLVLDTESRDA